MIRLFYLAGVLLVLALVLRSEVMSVVAIALAAATWMSSMWLSRVERGLRVHREVPEHLPLGDEAQVTLVLHNTALLRIPWLELRESVPFGVRLAALKPTVITLGAGTTHRISYAIRGNRRGWYSVGPLRIALGDVLGLRKVRLQVGAGHVIVYPRVLPLTVLGLPATLAYGPLRPQGNAIRTEDPSRPAGVRAYVAGDDVRRVDWKSSARQNTLLVRRADPSIAPETMMGLAFGKGDYPAELSQDALERAAIVAASLATALLQRKLPVGLVSNGFDPQNDQLSVRLGFGKGAAQQRIVLSALGRIAVSEGVELWRLLQAQPLPWGGTVVLIIADLTVDQLPELVTLRQRGQQIVLVLVEGTRGGLALAQQQRVAAYSVDRDGMPVQERSA